MLTPAPIYASRARWHYLFPEGLQEVYPRPGGKDEVTKYTPAVCRRLVETFDAVQRAGAAHGMAPQPIPVQLQHAGIVGSDNIHDLRRVGSLYALTYHGGNNGIPQVWIKESPERFRPAEVKTQPLDGERILVLAGIKPGARVVDLGLAPGGWTQIAIMRGVTQIVGNDGSLSWCTVAQQDLFFSHRRDRVSGRFAASIRRDVAA
jgi:hypothetical protein